MRAARGEPVKKLVVLRSGLVSGCEKRRLETREVLTLEVLEEVGHGFALVLQKERLIVVLAALAAA